MLDNHNPYQHANAARGPTSRSIGRGHTFLGNGKIDFLGDGFQNLVCPSPFLNCQIEKGSLRLGCGVHGSLIILDNYPFKNTFAEISFRVDDDLLGR
jgi:hypothetical protein